MKDIIDNGIKFRICYVCRKKLKLNTDNFYKNKTKSEGFELCCKNCSKRRLAMYYKNKPKKTEEELNSYNVYRNNWRKEQFSKGKCRVCKTSRLEHSVLCEKHYLQEVAIKHLGTASRWEELKTLWDKQLGKCAYSGRKLTMGLNASIDHIKPLSKHPELLNSVDNLQWVHKQLNYFKQDLEENEFIDFIVDITKNLNLIREFTPVNYTRTYE